MTYTRAQVDAAAASLVIQVAQLDDLWRVLETIDPAEREAFLADATAVAVALDATRQPAESAARCAAVIASLPTQGGTWFPIWPARK